MKRAHRGFSLIELMVVVAILGVLSVMVVIMVRTAAKPADVARRISGMVEQASRDAVRYGVVRTDVATTLGSKRRTRIRGVAGPAFVLELLVEDPTPAWLELGRYEVPSSVTADGFANAVGTYSLLSSSLETSWTSFELSCFPNGSCTPATLFFSSTRGPSMERQVRLSVLPLGAATYTINSWE